MAGPVKMASAMEESQAGIQSGCMRKITDRQGAEHAIHIFSKSYKKSLHFYFSVI